MELGLLLIVSIYFLWLVGKTIFSKNKDSNHYISIVILLIVSVSLGYWPVTYKLFEMDVEKKIRVYHGKDVELKCQSYLEDLVGYQASGWVFHGDPKIHMQYKTCIELKNFLKNPSNASKENVWGLHVLTHELVHVSGILDEKKTDCRAFQQNHRTAKQLGVNTRDSTRAAIIAYKFWRDPANSKYFSPECVPGGALDDEYDDAVWNLKP